MEGLRFDELTRVLATGTPRRRIFHVLTGAAAAAVAHGRRAESGAARDGCTTGCSGFRGPQKAACKQACRQCGGDFDLVCVQQGPFGPTGFVCPSPTGELTASDPTYDSCTVGTGKFYDAYTIEHAGGSLSVALRGATTCGGTLSDPFVGLYAGGFDPGNPCTNLIAEVDDVCGLDPFLNVDLTAGTYVVVATSFSGGQTGSYTLEFGGAPPC